MNHWKQLAAALEERGLDALLLTGEANRMYASGFYSPGGDGMALVTRHSAHYFTDSRYLEAAEAAVQGAVIKLVDRNNSYANLIKAVLEEENLSVLGFEDRVMTVEEHGRLQEKLGCTLRGASDLPEGLRAVKDPEEQEKMLRAQGLAEAAFEEILEQIRPGMRERELASKLQYAMLCRGAERMSFSPIVVSGRGSSLPHGVPGERVLAKGDFLTMDFGCVLEGYCSDTTRTLCIGQPTAEMRLVYDTVLRAQKAGIAAARAGLTGRELDAAARDVIREAGFGECFGHSFGHGVGLEIHEAPNASPANEKPLPAGAVISAEPGIYLPGRFGVRIEDVLILEEGGARNITKLPKELLIL